MARLAPTRTPDQIFGFTIHHSAVKGGNADLEAVKRRVKGHDEYHSLPKPWELIYTKAEHGFRWLSYHYAVAQNGEWMPTQLPTWKRYHAGDDWRGANSFNRWGIGILIEGNFIQETPSEACLQAAAEIVYNWEKTHGKRNMPVIGHKETGNSSCPGTNMGTSKTIGSPVWRIRQMANVMHGDAPIPITERMGTVTASRGLNVREKPFGKRLGALAPGATVEIVGESGKWLEIYYDDRKAWVHGDYIREFAAPAEPHNTDGRDEILLALEYAQKRVDDTRNPNRLDQLIWLKQMLSERLGNL